MDAGIDLSTPQGFRQAVRAGVVAGPTAGVVPGRLQANLVVLPEEHAADFLEFCQRNPKPCPVLEMTRPGNPEPNRTAPGSDLRTDVPRYRIFIDGRLHAEPTDIIDTWREDLVAFLLGCSFTFEHALLRAEIPVRHLEEKRNVPMFITNDRCNPVGGFSGPLVVSMRPIPEHLVERAVEVTSRYPHSHGAPVQVGFPEKIGIDDLGNPDFGDAVSIREGEVPVFWACGVTPQIVLMEARLPIAITHYPGHMFVTDLSEFETFEETALLE